MEKRFIMKCLGSWVNPKEELIKNWQSLAKQWKEKGNFYKDLDKTRYENFHEVANAYLYCAEQLLKCNEL